MFSWIFSKTNIPYFKEWIFPIDPSELENPYYDYEDEEEFE